MSKNFELLLQVEQQNGRPSAPRQARGVNPWHSPEPPVEAPNIIAETSDVREQMAMLVRRLFLLPETVRAAVITGVESGDGTTWIAMQCARVLAANVQGSVCIVDGNLRAPALHRYFGVAGHPGLRTAISQPASICEFARPLPRFRNLWFMPAGASDGPGAQTASVEHLCSHLVELRAKFDYVLIDSPPLQLCGDAVMLGRSADGIALVIAEQHTHRERARHAVQELSKANVRILGAVLNKRTFPIPQSIYDRL